MSENFPANRGLRLNNSLTFYCVGGDARSENFPANRGLRLVIVLLKNQHALFPQSENFPADRGLPFDRLRDRVGGLVIRFPR